MPSRLHETMFGSARRRTRRTRAPRLVDILARTSDNLLHWLTRIVFRATLALGALGASIFLIAVFARVLLFFWWKLNSALS